MNLTRKKQSGFTLIEIMIVVVIIGILAAVIVPNFTGKIDEANITKVKTDINRITGALDLYYSKAYRFPTQEQGLKALVTKPAVDPIPKRYPANGFLPKLPKDQWGSDYQYRIPGQDGRPYDVYSLGPDLESPEDDILNWDLDEH